MPIISALSLPNNAVLLPPNSTPTATSTLAGIHAAKISDPLRDRFAAAIILGCGAIIAAGLDPTEPNPDSKIVDLAKAAIVNPSRLAELADRAILSALSRGFVIANDSTMTNGVFDASTVPDQLILAFVTGMIVEQVLVLQVL
jgi:hypothetical protein